MVCLQRITVLVSLDDKNRKFRRVSERRSGIKGVLCSFPTASSLSSSTSSFLHLLSKLTTHKLFTMRFTLSLSALAALSSAIHAQKIDIALYEAAVASNTNAKGPAVMPDATSELVSRAPAGVSANVKRVGGGSNIKARQEQACGCAPRATGAAPVPTPDTVTAFRNFQEYQNTASSAVTPGGFNQTFQGLNASVSQNGYLGL